MLQDWGMLDKPCLAFYGKVAVEDIATWSVKGNEPTSKNLRQFRGLTEVNEGITKTLSTTPESFWYFNTLTPTSGPAPAENAPSQYRRRTGQSAPCAE